MPQESQIVTAHVACPLCGSSDAAAVYDDGHLFCYSCEGHIQKYDEGASVVEGTFDLSPKRSSPPTPDIVRQLMVEGEIRNLPKRGITQATCRDNDYYTRINEHGEGEHLAVIRDEGNHPRAIKIRNLGKDGNGKDFSIRPNMKQDGEEADKDLLLGAHLLGNGGKMLVVVGGEIDYLTVRQLWDSKFPVISPPLGEPSAAKYLAKHLDKISRYEKVVLCLDMDEVGMKANEECARMLRPGQAFIARLPLKDPNEMLLAGKGADLKLALFNAQPYRPDGILDADEVDHELDAPLKWGSSYAFPFLTKWTYGKKPGQVIVLGAGTGVGKTDWETEEVAHCIRPEEDGGCFEPTAVFNYEAGAPITLRAVLSKLWSKRFNIPDPEDGSANPYWSQEEFNAARAYRREKCAKLFINDAKGSADWEAVKERLRYLRHAHGITTAWIDPMAALEAEMEDERKAIDLLMAEAKAIAEELGITIIFLSHLARPKEGKSHEEGGRVRLSQFRGSNAIGMWASFVFAEERDQQGDDEEAEDVTIFRCLKDRETGDATGLTQALAYDTMTGRLEVVDGWVEAKRLSSQAVPGETEGGDNLEAFA